jgi:hypothetical protein
MAEEEKKFTVEDWHKKMGVDLYNRAWELLDKPDRTREEDDEMVHAAHASRFHWGKFGEPANLARGEWQVSRVYAALKRPEPALHHGQRCLDICEAHGIGDYDLGFAYESIARARALAGNEAETAKYMKLAQDAAEGIEKKEDREYFEGELKTIPGWGS